MLLHHAGHGGEAHQGGHKEEDEGEEVGDAAHPLGVHLEGEVALAALPVQYVPLGVLDLQHLPAGVVQLPAGVGEGVIGLGLPVPVVLKAVLVVGLPLLQLLPGRAEGLLGLMVGLLQGVAPLLELGHTGVVVRPARLQGLLGAGQGLPGGGEGVPLSVQPDLPGLQLRQGAVCLGLGVGKGGGAVVIFLPAGVQLRPSGLQLGLTGLQLGGAAAHQGLGLRQLRPSRGQLRLPRVQLGTGGRQLGLAALQLGPGVGQGVQGLVRHRVQKGIAPHKGLGEPGGVGGGAVPDEPRPQGVAIGGEGGPEPVRLTLLGGGQVGPDLLQSLVQGAKEGGVGLVRQLGGGDPGQGGGGVRCRRGEDLVQPAPEGLRLGLGGAQLGLLGLELLQSGGVLGLSLGEGEGGVIQLRLALLSQDPGRLQLRPAVRQGGGSGGVLRLPRHQLCPALLQLLLGGVQGDLARLQDPPGVVQLRLGVSQSSLALLHLGHTGVVFRLSRPELCQGVVQSGLTLIQRGALLVHEGVVVGHPVLVLRPALVQLGPGVGEGVPGVVQLPSGVGGLPLQGLLSQGQLPHGLTEDLVLPQPRPGLAHGLNPFGEAVQQGLIVVAVAEKPGGAVGQKPGLGVGVQVEGGGGQEEEGLRLAGAQGGGAPLLGDVEGGVHHPHDGPGGIVQGVGVVAVAGVQDDGIPQFQAQGLQESGLHGALARPGGEPPGPEPGPVDPLGEGVDLHHQLPLCAVDDGVHAVRPLHVGHAVHVGEPGQVLVGEAQGGEDPQVHEPAGVEVAVGGGLHIGGGGAQPRQKGHRQGGEEKQGQKPPPGPSDLPEGVGQDAVFHGLAPLVVLAKSALFCFRLMAKTHFAPLLVLSQHDPLRWARAA